MSREYHVYKIMLSTGTCTSLLSCIALCNIM